MQAGRQPYVYTGWRYLDFEIITMTTSQEGMSLTKKKKGMGATRNACAPTKRLSL
jgi:hypothetical protein